MSSYKSDAEDSHTSLNTFYTVFLITSSLLSTQRKKIEKINKNNANKKDEIKQNLLVTGIVTDQFLGHWLSNIIAWITSSIWLFHCERSYLKCLGLDWRLVYFAWLPKRHEISPVEYNVIANVVLYLSSKAFLVASCVLYVRV